LPAPSRNLQIDLLRGLALLSIYIDHIPNNPVSAFTIGGLGFFDAAEVFVFLSGITASRVFGNALDQRPLFGAAQVMHRCWTLYIVHLFLFILFSAQVSWTAAYFSNPMFAEEMQITSFLAEPHIAVLYALSLKFQPTFMDILPLYIVLLTGFVVAFPLLRRRPIVGLGLSAAVWAGAQTLGWSVAAYPSGVWFFNPLAWQLLFFLGVWLGRPGADLSFLWGPKLLRASIITAGALGLLHLGMTMGEIYDRVPAEIARLIWPTTGKTNLSLLRLINFLAAAHLVACLARRSPMPEARWLLPVIRCGQHSLNVFCIGLLLSFTAHLILVEVDSSAPALAALNLGGIAVMMLSAAYLHWYAEQKKKTSKDAGGS
jgi:hypothetical protein